MTLFSDADLVEKREAGFRIRGTETGKCVATVEGLMKEREARGSRIVSSLSDGEDEDGVRMWRWAGR